MEKQRPLVFSYGFNNIANIEDIPLIDAFDYVDALCDGISITT